MNYRIFTLLLSIFLLNTISFAQSRTGKDDEVAIDPISFEKARFSHLSIDGKKWIKASIKARCKGDPDAKAQGTDPDWLKDIELNLICAYEDSKKQMVWFSSDVKFYALERNKEYVLNFYIPWDIVNMHKLLRAEPVGYMIELKAKGKDYPLNAKNYRDRSSLSANSIVSFVNNASSNSGANQGVMTYFEDASFLVKYNDFPNAATLPTTVKRR